MSNEFILENQLQCKQDIIESLLREIDKLSIELSLEKESNVILRKELNETTKELDEIESIYNVVDRRIRKRSKNNALE